MSDDQDLSKEISEVLTAMSNMVVKEQNAEHAGKFVSLFGGAVVSPYQFNTIYGSQNSREVDSFVRLMVERVNPYHSQQKYVLEFLYSNYNFVKRFVSEQVKRFEGIACSVDKANGIISSVFKTISDKDYELPVEQEWFLPDVGALTLWYDLVVSLCHFYYGQTDKYVAAEIALTKFYYNKL